MTAIRTDYDLKEKNHLCTLEALMKLKRILKERLGLFELRREVQYVTNVLINCSHFGMIFAIDEFE